MHQHRIQPDQGRCGSQHVVFLFCYLAIILCFFCVISICWAFAGKEMPATLECQLRLENTV